MFRLLFSTFIVVLLLAGCDLNTFPDDPLPTVPSQVREDIVLFERLSPYFMRGYSVIEPGVTLTIEPGTRIIAESEGCRRDEIGSCATLIVSKGAFLVADGTAEAPILFTSDDDGRGDWGGIVINGDAPCNTGTDTMPLAETGAYCGDNSADSSGVLRYVVVENAGAIAVDSSTHYPGSIALHGVGNRTILEHVHAINSGNNGFSMVGGTVDLRNALSTCAAEHGFAWHDGWQGRGQFLIAQQCNDQADSGMFGSNVTPWDASLDLEPRSGPTIYNFSLMGSPDRSVGRDGIKLTLGTAATLVNGIVFNHKQKGFWIDDSESCLYIENGSIQLRNTYFSSNERDFTNRCGENALFLNDVARNEVGTDNFMQNPFSLAAPNFMLNSQGNAYPADPGAATLEWFEPADYIGGMGTSDWTEPLRISGN